MDKVQSTIEIVHSQSAVGAKISALVLGGSLNAIGRINDSKSAEVQSGSQRTLIIIIKFEKQLIN